MKIKLVVIILLGTIITILIYNITQNNKINLLALGDGIASGMTAYNVDGYSYNDYIKDAFKEKNLFQSYNNSFTIADLDTSELINMINNNVSKHLNGKEITIQQALSNANIITLAIGMDELINYSLNETLTQKVINNYYVEFNDLLTLIRKYNRKKIIVLGFYPAFELDYVDEINKNIKEISTQNECEFLDTSKLVTNREYYFNDVSYYLNYKGHKNLSKEILKLI